jgi:predicted aldo/keto reductase-like oxidoreductase
MQYRTDPKSGNKLSVLGYGCMRFPRNLAQIDMAKTEKLVLSAIDSGVNYFDTAYVYGGSEEALGAILQKNNARGKIFLATKLPHVKCRQAGDFDVFFSAQLERLHTEYIDYYLIHNLSDMKSWERLRALGIEAWLAGKKAEGKIRQLGFSFHGNYDEFLQLLDAYGWDFCQIQYNYMNTNYQAGTAGLKKAAEKGVAVIVMEPLLGGKLATGLPEKAVKAFKSVDDARAPAAWALKWLWNQKEVTVVLSGMNGEQQLADNLETAGTAEAGSLTEQEERVFESVREAFRAAYKVPCTGCNYCMPCPQGINIPACFSAYNMRYAAGLMAGIPAYITSTGLTNPDGSSSPSKCVKCGKCEKACPQHIEIRKSLEDVRRHMEPLWLRAALRVVMKFMK